MAERTVHGTALRLIGWCLAFLEGYRMKRTAFFSGGVLMAAALAFAAPAGASTKKAVHNGLIGAAGGAVVGAVVPGMSVGTGALIGGAGGAAIGALDHSDRRYHRDRHGRRYWVDKHGRRHYKR